MYHVRESLTFLLTFGNLRLTKKEYMMKKMHIVLLIIAALIVPLFIGLYSLGMFKLFAPATANIQREVFENTKSYLQAAQQDLGKYYHEYQSADQTGKSVIKATIRVRFAELDGSKLQSREMERFLKEARGY